MALSERNADSNRTISVYDGTSHLGEVMEAGKQFHVLDATGAPAGTFSSIKEAARSLPSRDAQRVR